MRQYFTQMRQEMGLRLVDRVFGPDDKPSKVNYIYMIQSDTKINTYVSIKL